VFLVYNFLSMPDLYSYPYGPVALTLNPPSTSSINPEGKRIRFRKNTSADSCGPKESVSRTVETGNETRSVPEGTAHRSSRTFLIERILWTHRPVPVAMNLLLLLPYLSLPVQTCARFLLAYNFYNF